MVQFSEKENLVMLELAYESERYGTSIDFESYIKKSINETKKELKREERREKISSKNV